MDLAKTFVGRRLGDFLVRDKVGEGGFGEVYRAEQLPLEREAVVKILHPRNSDDEITVKRFLREAKLAARLDHPHAAHIYAYGAESDGVLWIAMELVKGVSLSAFLAVHGKVALRRFVPFLEQLCDVVHSAHEQGVIHRDIKPANVMVVARAGRLFPKLLDLGVAKLIHGEKTVEAERRPWLLATEPVSDMTVVVPRRKRLNGDTELGTVIGSPLYMAPELWRGEEGSASSDQYAIGVLCYEALAGRRPFTGHTFDEVAQAHLAPIRPRLGPDFPPALDAALRKAMARDPAGRFADVLAFAAAFHAASELAAEEEGLPRLDPSSVERWLRDGPRPIAEALAGLETARNAHQARDAMRGVARSVIRWLCVLALAEHGPADAPEGGDAAWLELAAKLSTGAAADLHAIPELTAFFAEGGAALAGELLAACEAARDQVPAEATVAHLAHTLPLVERLLGKLVFLCDYPAVVGRPGPMMEPLVGVGARAARPTASKLADGEVVVTDREGEPVLRLGPLAQVASPAPGAAEELFLFAGRGRHGALLVSLPRGFERHDETMAEWLGGAAAGAGPASGEERAPYRGLAAFTAGDAENFIGREREVVELVNRLRLQPLVVVVGPSGAGKSSFVQAGVVANLPREWTTLILRPGSAPLASLASAVAGLLGDDATALRAELARDPGVLGARLAARASMTVLVVDQLEELFTLCPDSAEREAFGEALARAAPSLDAPVRVVATLRDDFLVRAERLPGLRRRIALGLHLLTTPAPEDLLRILVDPARRAGYAWEPPTLSEEMVSAVAEEPGALALLSFTAARLWTLRDRHLRHLTRTAYDAMGGVGGALSHHAEAVLGALPEGEQPLVREVFRQLITAEGTRAVLTRRELLQILGAGGERVIDALVGERLLVTSEIAGEADRIEVIHEALLVAWPRLVAWHHEDLEEGRLHGQLRAAARQWHDRGRPRGLLWRDDALTEYRVWRSRYRGGLTDLEEAFARASLADAARARRFRVALVSGAFVAMSAVAVVLYGLYMQSQRQRAEARRQVALQYEEQGREALLVHDHFRALVYLSEAYTRGVDTAAMRFMLARAAQVLTKQLHVLGGHTDSLRAAVWTRDGARVLTGSLDGSVRVWDSASGAPVRTLATNAGPVTSVVLSPDEKLVGIASRDGTARVLDASTGQVVAAMAGQRDLIGGIAFSADGSHVMTFGGSSDVRLWRIRGAELVAKLVGHTEAVEDAHFLGSDRAITGSGDGTVRVWQLSDGTQVQVLGGGGAVYRLAVSPTGDLVAAGTLAGGIRVWRTSDWQPAVKLADHKRWVSSIAFSPDGRRLLTASDDKTAKVWSLDTGTAIASLDHQGAVTVARFDPAGERVVTGSSDKTAGVWDARTGKLVSRLVAHSESVLDASFSPDGARVVTASDDRTARLWDPRADDVIAELRPHPGPVWRAGLLGSDRAWTSSLNGGLSIWDARRGALLDVRRKPVAVGESQLAGQFDARAATVSRDGLLAATTRGAEVTIWTEDGDETLALLSGHTGRVWAVAISPDGRSAATVDDRLARIWSLPSGSLLAVLEGHLDLVVAVDFSPDGRRLVTASEDDTARVWDLETKAAVVLKGHSRDLYSAVFSADGERVVTASKDKTLRLWSSHDGVLLRTFIGHSEDVYDAAITADGMLAVSACADGSVGVWDTGTGKMITSFRRHTQQVAGVTIERSGARALSASIDGTALLWDLSREQRTPEEIAISVRCNVPFALRNGVYEPAARYCK